MVERSGYGEQDDISGVIEVQRIPPMPEFDIFIVKAIFHERIEQTGYCTHRNQHVGGQECGVEAIEFIAEYAERYMKEYGVQCTICEKWLERDERGDVLDASGRCDECRP